MCGNYILHLGENIVYSFLKTFCVALDIITCRPPSPLGKGDRRTPVDEENEVCTAEKTSVQKLFNGFQIIYCQSEMLEDIIANRIKIPIYINISVSQNFNIQLFKFRVPFGICSLV